MADFTLVDLLAEGDMRTTRNAAHVADLVIADPTLCVLIIGALENESPGVRMRAADSLAKIARGHQAILLPFAEQLLRAGEQSRQQEVQWHCAEIYRYLGMTSAQNLRATEICRLYLRLSKSAIVRAHSLESFVALADTCQSDEVDELLRTALKDPSAAVRARARKIVKIKLNLDQR